MIILYILLAILGSFVLFFTGGVIYAYNRTYKMPKVRAVYSNEKQKNEIVKSLVDELCSYPYEEIYIKSYDGTRLFGRYYHVSDGAPMQIIFHGYRGFAVKDACAAAKISRELLHNMIIVDQRGHGKSGTNTTCFGIKERHDVAAWAWYAYNRFGDGTPIFLTGASMGGNSVLMAIEQKLPKTVVGVISDGAFSSPTKVIKHTINANHIPKILLPYTSTYVAGLLCGFNLAASSPTKAVKGSDMPILIFHGTNDSIVPCEMAKEIYDASSSSNKFLYIFEGAGHVLCYSTDPEKYTNAFKQFVELCLNQKNILYKGETL